MQTKINKVTAKKLARTAEKITRQDHDTGSSITNDTIVTYDEMLAELQETGRWFTDQINHQVTISTFYRVTFVFQV